MPLSRRRVTLCEAFSQIRSYMEDKTISGNITMKCTVLLLASGLALASLAAHAKSAMPFRRPWPKLRRKVSGLETAVLAGGCFWGVQAVYQHVKGVKNAVSGYAGGTQKDAVYETISLVRTGHAESVKVTFDPREISYGKILQIYFSVAHDPTQLNRPGPDAGPQYRSEIFPQSEAQQKIAQNYITQLDKTRIFKRPIVTKTDTMKTPFFAAEAYHQDYAIKHPLQPYIAINDAPKVGT